MMTSKKKPRTRPQILSDARDKIAVLTNDKARIADMMQRQFDRLIASTNAPRGSK